MGRPFSRRQLLQRASLLGACLALPARALWAETAPAPRPMPWRNWSGAQSCLPLERLAPKSLDELVRVIRQAPGKIRPVGSGHSFSALVPTDGTLLSLSHFAGLLEHDARTPQAEFAGGTPMAQMGAPLKALGQALVNLAFSKNAYEVSTIAPVNLVFHDLIARSYTVLGLRNNEKAPRQFLLVAPPQSYFTPGSLRRKGTQ